MEKITIDSKFADQEGEIMVVELGGYVDQSNSYQLQKMFDNIIQSGCFKVIVDFSKLYYMSSAGWGVFVGEIKRFRENGGDIKLAAMNPEIYDVYQMLEFYHILDDYPRVEDAAASFGKDEEELNLVLNGEQVEPADTPVQDDTETQEKLDLIDGTIEDSENILIEEDTDKEEKIELEIENESERETAEIISFTPGEGESRMPSDRRSREFIPHALQSDIKLPELPLPEKVKKVVAQNPLLGLLGIRKVLRHEHFGHTRVGLFELWRLLRRLDLDSKEKRYRYYRSC
ncbi:MAG TPA: anti-sigma factor antagonist [Caldithrix abyssi]|uniref:Anti-sigma factor antagonist n=1 Tax=Caldithrix abyssi TaxID=187145 RepID=A0A7V4U1F6_CALAY|nr:anti-sigma factor antagonist [Caldithrix abyssi]